MKSIKHFKKENVCLSTEEAANIKGGLRFFTYNESIYTQFRNLLSYIGISFNHGAETEADGRKHYCIEW